MPAALTALLRTELPIIQAPMAGVQGSALAIAVSEAGGLGSLPAAMLPPEALQRELAPLSDETLVEGPILILRDRIRQFAAATAAEAIEGGGLSRRSGAESAPSAPQPDRTAELDGRALPHRIRRQSSTPSQEQNPSGPRTRGSEARANTSRAAPERAPP